MTSILIYIFISTILFSLVAGQTTFTGHRAWQSTTLKPQTGAEKAIDGNSDPNLYNGGSCSHTACKDKAPYWIMCLGDQYDITAVTITNAIQAKGRLRNIQIEVFEADPTVTGSVGQTCGSIGTTPAPDGARTVVTCGTTLTGRYIKITKMTETYNILNNLNAYQQHQGNAYGHYQPYGQYQQYGQHQQYGQQQQYGYQQYGNQQQYGNKVCDALILCEVEVTSTLSFNCGTTFTTNGDSCYMISEYQLDSWFEARAACQAIGADLVVIDNAAESAFLQGAIPDTNAIVYIGGNKFLDTTTPIWTWVDPDADPIPNTPGGGGGGFEDWAAGEPADTATDFCLAIEFTANVYTQWHDQPCGTTAFFVCEKNLNFPTREVTPC